jgi:tetratricopeptide (TPR) repeat protein
MMNNRISGIENHLHQGKSHQSEGRLGEAYAEFSKIIEINPNIVMGYCSRGCLYLQTEDWDRAIADLDQALSLAPNYGFAYFNRAHAYLGKKKSNKAWEDIQKAIELGFKVKPEMLENIEKTLVAA